MNERKTKLISNNNSFSLYINWPYCERKCHYCAFNTYISSKTIDIQKFAKNYAAEIDFIYKNTNYHNIKTIFFGGGTPSLMPIKLIEFILNKVSEKWQTAEAEITLEANPHSLLKNQLLLLKKAGINRISLGVQSLRNEGNKFLGRIHDLKTAINSIHSLQDNFDNYSIDLIYAYEGQTMKQWEKELSLAYSLQIPHISAYQLIIEKKTKLYKRYLSKPYLIPHEDKQAEMFKLTQNLMSSAGYLQYEISNFAKIPHVETLDTMVYRDIDHNNSNKLLKNNNHLNLKYISKHNLAYWQYKNYVGIGPSACGRFKFNGKLIAWQGKINPSEWHKICDTKDFYQQITNLLPKEIAYEISLMGLRCYLGIKEKTLQDYCNIGFSTVFDINKIKYFKEKKLLIYDANQIILTPKGYLYLDHILESIISL